MRGIEDAIRRLVAFPAAEGAHMRRSDRDQAIESRSFCAAHVIIQHRPKLPGVGWICAAGVRGGAMRRFGERPALLLAQLFEPLIVQEPRAAERLDKMALELPDLQIAGELH